MGPGATAGKAILAMGKATLRSVESLIISRRLAAIRAAIPCTDNKESQNGHLEKMFGDLLELSRPGLYPEGVRIQAMQILLAQIATEHTHLLRLSIAKWDVDSEELDALLREIIAVALFSSRGFPDARLVDAYTAALSKDLHPWTACIAFISQLAQMNERTFQMALNVQLLDILVLLVQQISQQERWLMVERRLLEKHIHSMLRNITSQSSLSNFGDIYISSTAYVPRLADALPSLPSIRTLMWCIGIGGAAQNETMNFLSALSYAKKVAVLDLMMRDLVIQFIVQPYVLPFPQKPAHLKVQLPRPTPYSRLAKSPEFIAYVVRFLLNISQYSPAIEEAVMEAALLQILPFLAPSWEPSRIYDDICRRVHSRVGLKSSEIYNPQTRSLLAVMQSLGLVEILFHEVGTKTKINLGQLLEPIFSRGSKDVLGEKLIDAEETLANHAVDRSRYGYR
ncbi:hypothetical protein B0H13DRAFT_2446229 [Mycena leptocephala]|nr:hypothetical protein B0H13DRAFT_2446229 [Mycena leptocephala]